MEPFGFDELQAFNKWFDPAIMNMYIRERNFAELEDTHVKEKTKNALRFIKGEMNKRGILTIEDYFKSKVGYMPLFVTHFLQGKINNMILAWVWLYHRDWITSLDPEIFDSYLAQFKKHVYRHINTLVENRNLYNLVKRSFSILG